MALGKSMGPRPGSTPTTLPVSRKAGVPRPIQLIAGILALAPGSAGASKLRL
jgi:hypothetical protein